RRDLHVEERTQGRLDSAEPFERGVEAAEPHHERHAVGHEPLRRRHPAVDRPPDPIEGAERQSGMFDFADPRHGRPPGDSSAVSRARVTLATGLWYRDGP